VVTDATSTSGGWWVGLDGAGCWRSGGRGRVPELAKADGEARRLHSHVLPLAEPISKTGPCRGRSLLLMVTSCSLGALILITVVSLWRPWGGWERWTWARESRPGGEQVMNLPTPSLMHLGVLYVPHTIRKPSCDCCSLVDGITLSLSCLEPSVSCYYLFLLEWFLCFNP
jgi:hypothetical protein